MANYPDSIYEPRAKENRAGIEYDPTKKTVIFAEDIVKDDDEIVAVETELGTNPKGAYASVKAFLEDLLAKVISLFTDIPDVPDSYEGQGGKAVVVKATEDGLEFAPPPAGGIANVQVGRFTRNASGNETIAIGFIPKVILFFAQGASEAGQMCTSQGVSIGIGADNNRLSVVATSSAAYYVEEVTGYCIRTVKDSYSNRIQGRVTTFASNTVIEFLTAGAVPTAKVMWVALA